MWSGAEYGGWMHDGAWTWWAMGLHGLGWLVFLVVLILLGVVLIRALWRGGTMPGAGSGGQPGGGADPARSRALEILAERYARGEIDREEFLRRKEDLA